MRNQAVKRALIIAISATTALGTVTPALSAPVLSNVAALKAAAPNVMTDVRYRGNGYRRNNNGAAVALGILGVVGAVAAASAYRHNQYGGPYGYYGSPGYDGSLGYYGSNGYPGYYGQRYGGPYHGPANYGGHYVY